MTDTSGFNADNPTTITVTGKRKPKTGYQLYVPQCFVDIYTFEGGDFSLTDQPQMRVEVTKDIHEPAGSFMITLPPGGPNGPNVPPSWTQVITPMSFVVIGMRRGNHEQITMLGVVTDVGETEIWNPGEPVQRAITIAGQDFSYYFTKFTYYVLWYLAATGVSISPEAQSAFGGATNDPQLGPALISGRPDQIAQAWYSVVMAGPKGILAATDVPFQNARVTFPNAMATLFEQFSAFANAFSDFLITSESDWMTKFRSILPYPWYEFFVITAPTSFYPTASGGYSFTSTGLSPAATASPTLVGRVNPLPRLTTSTDTGVVTFTGIDNSAWLGLPLFDLENAGFLTDSVGFSEELVLNFFSLNPTWARGMNGQSNSNIIPYLNNFFSAGDTASIRRYGFRPANGEIKWLSDMSGGLSEQENVNQTSFIADMLGRFCSIYEPMPLMARANVTMIMRPDIMPGCRFRYNPFKNDKDWDFYIESVTHRFQFGGPATTTLKLTRGLPKDVYADASSNGLLFNIHIGNAERINGDYQVGVPQFGGAPLQGIGVQQFQPFFAGLSQTYVTPQATAAGS